MCKFTRPVAHSFLLIFILSGLLVSQTPEYIIDPHIHIFDPTRPQGVPWPFPGEPLHSRVITPQTWRDLTEPMDITGAIVIECSEWFDDNQWVLDQIQDVDYMYGMAGNLVFGAAEFDSQIEQLAQNEKFLGLRLRTQTITRQNLNQAMKDDFQLMADMDLALDVLPQPESNIPLDAVLAIAEQVPDLRIMPDHCAGASITGGEPGGDWRTTVEALARQPNAYVKISSLFNRASQNPAPTTVGYYTPMLDFLLEQFGEDRLIYASNWPVLEYRGQYDDQLQIILEYFSAKGDTVLQKVMWQNAVAFYKPPIGPVKNIRQAGFDRRLDEAYRVTLLPDGIAVDFHSPGAEQIDLAIYTTSGRKIFTANRAAVSPGHIRLVWDRRDMRGDRVSAGGYLCRIHSHRRDRTLFLGPG